MHTEKNRLRTQTKKTGSECIKDPTHERFCSPCPTLVDYGNTKIK